MLMPGVYNEQIYLKSEYKGTKENPTVIKSHKKWLASISTFEDFCAIIDYKCDWTIIDGLRLTGSNLGGLLIRSDNNVIKNCWILNNTNGIYIHQRIGINIENNLIEFNGKNIVDNHGISGSGSNISILNNVLRHNGSYGIHLFPRVERLVMINNIIHHQLSGNGIIASLDIRDDDSKILNNTVIEEGRPLSLFNAKSDFSLNGTIEIFNNVFISEQEKFSVLKNEVFYVLDNNFFFPEIKKGGSNKIRSSLNEIKSGFIDPQKNNYLLKNSSPLISKGKLIFNNDKNFWGLNRKIVNGKVDIGAFSYLPKKITENILNNFKENFPYYKKTSFDLKNSNYYPDFWDIAQ